MTGMRAPFCRSASRRRRRNSGRCPQGQLLGRLPTVCYRERIGEKLTFSPSIRLVHLRRQFGCSISRQAAACGAAITLEGVPESSFGSLEGALQVARACGEPNCFVLLDTWHLVRTGGGLADVRALPAGMIAAVQLSDRTEPAPGSAYVPMAGRKLPGEGELPLAEFVAAALANNPGLTFEFEVFSDELEALPTGAAFGRVARAIETWRDSGSSLAGSGRNTARRG